jgi:hypothetical protein
VIMLTALSGVAFAIAFKHSLAMSRIWCFAVSV